MEETLKKVRSKQEKELLAMVMNECEPLPYELVRHVDDEYEDELLYLIPDDDKERVFKKLWPFVGMPKMDTVLLDIHSEQLVMLKHCSVIRWNKRNIIVSPHYFTSGGTVLDLIEEKNVKYFKQLKDI